MGRNIPPMRRIKPPDGLVVPPPKDTKRTDAPKEWVCDYCQVVNTGYVKRCNECNAPHTH